MTQDARQSLIALGSVTLFVGLFAANLSIFKVVEIPDWILPLCLALMTIDFAWRFGKWIYAKRSAQGKSRITNSSTRPRPSMTLPKR
jgi:hypothetical protein